MLPTDTLKALRAADGGYLHFCELFTRNKVYFSMKGHPVQALRLCTGSTAHRGVEL